MKRSSCVRASVRALAALGIASLVSGSAFAQQGMRNGEWHSWGGDFGSMRYAPCC